jgi:hypothetical protein
MMPKYFPMTKQSNHQSALGQYGQGGGGHGHDWPRAEGGDGVFPPLVVPLLTGGTPSCRGPHCDQSLYPKYSFLPKFVYVHRARCLPMGGMARFSFFNTCFIFQLHSNLIRPINKPCTFSVSGTGTDLRKERTRSTIRGSRYNGGGPSAQWQLSPRILRGLSDPELSRVWEWRAILGSEGESTKWSLKPNQLV